MKLLLDTHVWLWALSNPSRLSRRVREELTRPENELWLSPVSTWEALLLNAQGLIRLRVNLADWLTNSTGHLREAPFTHEIVLLSQQVPLPHRDRVAIGIIAGADGNLCFTESAGHRIGRITPGGVITEFRLPTATAGPNGIACGPDGNIWFAEEDVDQVVRITPQGFTSNNAGGVLGGISSGQDIVAHIALKPTSSILIPGCSIDIDGNPVEVITTGRHDPCVGIRATPLAEAMSEDVARLDMQPLFVRGVSDQI